MEKRKLLIWYAVPWRKKCDIVCITRISYWPPALRHVFQNTQKETTILFLRFCSLKNDLISVLRLNLIPYILRHLRWLHFFYPTSDSRSTSRQRCWATPVHHLYLRSPGARNCNLCHLCWRYCSLSISRSHRSISIHRAVSYRPPQRTVHIFCPSQYQAYRTRSVVPTSLLALHKEVTPFTACSTYPSTVPYGRTRYQSGAVQATRSETSFSASRTTLRAIVRTPWFVLNNTIYPFRLPTVSEVILSVSIRRATTLSIYQPVNPRDPIQLGQCSTTLQAHCADLLV